MAWSAVPNKDGLICTIERSKQIFSTTSQSMDLRKGSKWFSTWLNDIIDLIIQSFFPPWGILKCLGGNKQIRLIERDLVHVSCVCLYSLLVHAWMCLQHCSRPCVSVSAIKCIYVGAWLGVCVCVCARPRVSMSRFECLQQKGNQSRYCGQWQTRCRVKKTKKKGGGVSFSFCFLCVLPFCRTHPRIY